MKIAIIGYSGSGKSTLAKKLASHYEIPYLHMDTLRFLPNWVSRSDEEMNQQLADFLAQQDQWVIDGNYSSCFYEERMQEADQIIWFNFNRFNCLYRACKRYWTYRGKRRDSAAEGCLEKLDWEFIRWILYDGRRKTARYRYRLLCQTYPQKMVVLKNQKELNRLLDSLEK